MPLSIYYLVVLNSNQNGWYFRMRAHRDGAMASDERRDKDDAEARRTRRQRAEVAGGDAGATATGGLNAGKAGGKAEGWL